LTRTCDSTLVLCTSQPLTEVYMFPLATQVKMATLQLFGSDEQCAAANAMIEEAIDTGGTKAKQRAKEYDKKKEVSGGALICETCR